MENSPTYSAFQGNRKISDGPLVDVALKVKSCLEKDKNLSILVFNNITSKVVDLDLRGSSEEVRNRLDVSSRPGPGRPKLGVVSREISLLPHHWEWLSIQSGGASATLRRLVEEAGKLTRKEDRVRMAKDATYGFMRVMAGDLEGYEEALRALYAGDKKVFFSRVAAWPKDLRSHIDEIAKHAW